MKKHYRSSGSSLFLLEIMVNVLLFSVLLVICLQFFMKAHTLTRETTEIERATTLCSNIASLYEAGDGSLTSISEAYPGSVVFQTHVVLYLDSNFNNCAEEDAVYTIIATYGNGSIRCQTLEVTCKSGDREIYTITCERYNQRTAEGGES